MYVSFIGGHQHHVFAPRRALARARAIEIGATNGGNEETMCPVCHESTPLLLVLGFN